MNTEKRWGYPRSETAGKQAHEAQGQYQLRRRLLQVQKRKSPTLFGDRPHPTKEDLEKKFFTVP